jgi:hypothetical protein
MSGTVEEVVDAGAFYDPSGVHREHPVRELGRDREIV